MSQLHAAIRVLALLVAAAIPASGQMRPMADAQLGGSGARPPILDRVGIDQKLDNQVPLDLEFRDEAGRTVKLGDYFGKKPVLLSLVYLDCPQLCTQVINGVVRSLRPLTFTPGEEFTLLTVSFDPRETPEMAAIKKDVTLKSYNRPAAAEGWHFLTGGEASIKSLTAAVGFRYAWDENLRQFAHASGVMILTPDGRVSRYLYGIEYAPRDLRLALVEASAGKIGNVADQVLLLCYHYDPAIGKYGIIVMNVVRILAVLLMIGFAAFYLLMRYRGRLKRREAKVGYSHSALIPFLFQVQVPFAPEQASTFAAQVDNIYLFLVVLTAFFTITIGGAELFFAIKYRRRSAGEIPPQIKEHKGVETAWIVIPFLIVMFIFFWSASIYFRMYRPPKEALEIFITGKQWMWRAQHPDGAREINELHLPLGRRIKLTMTSEDVIHSYFIPAFRTKADVVPGRYTTTWFEPIKTGTYHLFCAEYCGTQHSGMIGKVYVLDPAEYQRWLSGGTDSSSPVATGQKLFTSLACNTCHQGGNQGRGPALEGLVGKDVRLDNGLTVKADENYIRESILNPRAKVVAGYDPIMPTFQGQVSEEQILQLISYIRSISPPAGIGPGNQGAALPSASPSPAQRPASQ